MNLLTTKRVFIVGFADLAYRLFLRGFVRRYVGIEQTATELLSNGPYSRAPASGD
jgi:hypothetical protein